MISVVLCKVSQPSRYNRKSYDGNFVPAKCSCINYGATLISHFDTINGFSGSGRDSGWIEVFEKVLTSSPLLFSRRFSLVCFSTARPPFSLVFTDRERGKKNTRLHFAVLETFCSFTQKQTVPGADLGGGFRGCAPPPP